MAVTLNETHDPALGSFVEAANVNGCEFPIQNLPFGVFCPATGRYAARRRCDRRPNSRPCRGRAVVRGAAADGGASLRRAAAQSSDVARPAGVVGAAACAVARVCAPSNGDARSARSILRRWRSRAAAAGRHRRLHRFLASVFITPPMSGALLRPDNPLMPNYKYVPVAYHGRASSVRVSGTPVRAAAAASASPPNEAAPSYGPSRNLDFELELGFYIGAPATNSAKPIPIGKAAEHIFGFCLLNDWSARDIQALGISAARAVPRQEFRHHRLALGRHARRRWRRSAPPHSRGPRAIRRRCRYLDDADDQRAGGLDITLEAYLATETMRRAGTAPHRLTQTSFAPCIGPSRRWSRTTPATAATSRPAICIGSGTVSGRRRELGQPAGAYRARPRAD